MLQNKNEVDKRMTNIKTLYELLKESIEEGKKKDLANQCDEARQKVRNYFDGKDEGIEVMLKIDYGQPNPVPQILTFSRDNNENVYFETTPTQIRSLCYANTQPVDKIGEIILEQYVLSTIEKERLTDITISYIGMACKVGNLDPKAIQPAIIRAIQKYPEYAKKFEETLQIYCKGVDKNGN